MRHSTPVKGSGQTDSSPCPLCGGPGRLVEVKPRERRFNCPVCNVVFGVPTAPKGGGW